MTPQSTFPLWIARFVAALFVALTMAVHASPATAQSSSAPGATASSLETLTASETPRDGASQRKQKVSIELISGTAEIRPGQPFWVALRQRIAPGWHTYWENPGDSGEPTRIDWTLPPGFQASDIHWPAPEAVRVSSLMNYGYKGEALLLVEITPPERIAEKQVRLRADSTWLVCEEICIPENGRASVALAIASDGAPPKPGAGADEIASALRNLPKQAPWPLTLTVAPDKLALSIQDSDLRRSDVQTLRFFPREWGMVKNAAPQPLTWQESGPRLTLTRGERKGQPIEQLSGVLSVNATDGSRRAYEISVAPSQTVAEIAPAASSGLIPGGGLSLWQAAGFALLGGLILNLFPCVFPVLSMKALSLARGGTARADRRHALAYLGGVMLSFAILAGLLLVLRATGAAFGWGFQFQSPWFVLVMAALFFALGLSLSGVFNFGGAVMGVGDNLARRGGASGSFFTGVLASIAATPCTAPFMGVALGYAMTQPAMQSTTVVMMLGLGFALPMTLLSLSGAFARLLPKPGPWMETLKQALAFPLYASAVWLVWVLSLQTGASGVLAAGAVLVAVGFAAWLIGAFRVSPALRYACSAAVIAVAFVAAAPVIEAGRVSGAAAPERSESAPGELSEPFSVAQLEALRDEGRPVFVNLTAAWCITCKVNEEVALKSDAFRQALKRGNIAYLIGDWTNQDPEISKMLEKFGRAGVPLYLLYPRGGGQPEILPQILTEGMMLRRFAEISERQTSQK